MPAIETIKFGKTLRPTTVECVNKINELIGAINSLNVADITTLKTDVSNLKATVGANTSQINTAKSDINELKKTTTGHTTDIDKIKITLYTPLEANDTKE